MYRLSLISRYNSRGKREFMTYTPKLFTIRPFTENFANPWAKPSNAMQFPPCSLQYSLSPELPCHQSSHLELPCSGHPGHKENQALWQTIRAEPRRQSSLSQAPDTIKEVSRSCFDPAVQLIPRHFSLPAEAPDFIQQRQTDPTTSFVNSWSIYNKILVVFLPVSLEHFVNQQCITKIGKLTLVRKGWIFRNLVLKQTQKERQARTYKKPTSKYF